jgi:hypothetical protein
MHNEELHNSFFPPSIITMVKSRWMRLAVNVSRIGVKMNAYRLLVGRIARWKETIR